MMRLQTYEGVEVATVLSRRLVGHEDDALRGAVDAALALERPAAGGGRPSAGSVSWEEARQAQVRAEDVRWVLDLEGDLGALEDEQLVVQRQRQQLPVVVREQLRLEQ